MMLTLKLGMAVTIASLKSVGTALSSSMRIVTMAIVETGMDVTQIALMKHAEMTKFKLAKNVMILLKEQLAPQTA